MHPEALFVSILEEAGNRLLRLDPETLRRLGDLPDRPVCVEFRDLGRKVYLYPSEAGFRLTTTSELPPAVTLRGNLPAFVRLGTTAGQGGPAVGELEIEGDVGLGQRLQHIIQDLDPDWEEPLTRIAGDALGHQLGRALRAAFAWHRQALHTFGINIAEYLQEESRILPVRAEVDTFLDSVDVLRSDVDRLAARIERLRQRSSA
jgi:ubiquinone biosynthesis protein UbiJ